MNSLYTSGELTLESCLIERYGSIENLMAEAKNGNVQAQADLGAAYCDGVGNLLEKDTKKAIGWLNAAVEKGCNSPYVIERLGVLFDKRGTPQSQQKAYKMYCRAAKAGCAESQLNLAEMYRCGIDGVVNEDIREAFEWYKCAADEKPLEIDSRVDQLLTGTVKKIGIIGKSNANHTKITALKLLYSNYLDGDCPECRPQPTKAVHYLNRAAELGDTEAQRDLGKIYLNGSCEQLRDVAKARRWLGKASAKGDQKAKQLLELCKQPDNTPSQTSKISADTINQSLEVKFEKLKLKDEAKVHPFAIRQPVLFTEKMLSGFQCSPTAGIYLKALKLVQKGFEILTESLLTDGSGLSYIAYGFLTENSILQAFPQWPLLSSYIFQLCDKILQENPGFLEALVVSFALQGIDKVPLETSKSIVRKLACIQNIIGFIQVAEPNGTPCEDPFEFGKSKSSWFHVLYYHIGCIYTIEGEYDAAIEAFENSLECCPSYFESKRMLGFCLLMLSCSRSEVRIQKELDESGLPTERITISVFPKQKIPEREEPKYASYSEEQLQETAVYVLKEYLQEAPKCFKTYPNVYYYLAYLAFCKRNMKEFKEYYERGQDAEEKRLPFFDPVDLPIKDTVCSYFYQWCGNVKLPATARCGNSECTKKVAKKDLKSCPCGNVRYCNKDCQKADWKIHKISCSTRSNKAKSDT